MRDILRFIIQLGVIVGLIRLLVRFTTLDDKVISFFRENSSTSQTGGNTNIDPNACSTPWGLKIPDGSSIYAYRTETPGGSGECKEELRTCHKGSLDGSYPYASCNPASNNGDNDGDDQNNDGQVSYGASCTTPRGETVNDGGYIIAYESAQSCRFEKRYCENGRLNGSYSSHTCYSPVAMNQGGSSSTVTQISYGYVQGPSAYNSEYQGPSRTSANGNTTVIYSWNDNKTNPSSKSANNNNYIQPTSYKNYDLTQHGCTTPWGTYLDHGSHVIAYKTSAPTNAGASCAYERRTCFQGVLGGSYGFPSCGKSDPSKIYNNNGQDYFYPQHTSAGKSCKTSWGETVQHGDYVMAYKSSTTSQGHACVGEHRYCINGKLQGSYTSRSCTMNQANYSCTLPRGGKLPHGSSVIAYANNSYSCGNSQLRTCSYGKLSGTYGYSSCYDNSHNNNNNGCYGNNCGHHDDHGCYGNNCYDNTPHYGNASCALPWGGTIMNGASIIAYNSSVGPCSSQVRTCYNGQLNGSYQYSWCGSNNTGPNTCPNGNCGGSTHTPRSCYFNGQAIPYGGKIEAYQNTSAPCYKEVRTCRDNGYLDGSFQHSYCNATGPTNTTQGTDSYGNWTSAGQHEGNIDNSDTCNANATSSYICGSESSNSCTDYRKLNCSSFSPMICNYEQRTVSCVR